jgi:hypothetical protein
MKAAPPLLLLLLVARLLVKAANQIGLRDHPYKALVRVRHQNSGGARSSQGAVPV